MRPRSCPVPPSSHPEPWVSVWTEQNKHSEPREKKCQETPKPSSVCMGNFNWHFTVWHFLPVLQAGKKIHPQVEKHEGKKWISIKQGVKTRSECEQNWKQTERSRAFAFYPSHLQLQCVRAYSLRISWLWNIQWSCSHRHLIWAFPHLLKINQGLILNIPVLCSTDIRINSGLGQPLELDFGLQVPNHSSQAAQRNFLPVSPFHI